MLAFSAVHPPSRSGATFLDLSSPFTEWGEMFYELPLGYNNGTDTYFCSQLCDFGQMACPSQASV